MGREVKAGVDLSIWTSMGKGEGTETFNIHLVIFNNTGNLQFVDAVPNWNKFC